MTNTIIETEKIVALMKKPEFNGYTDCPFHGEAVVVQEIEIPTFTKGEFQCQTLQIVEKELKGQAV